MSTLDDLNQMIRPWYRGGELDPYAGCHIYTDCEVLTEEGEPREGVGWLNPLGSDVCDECAKRHDLAAYEKRMDDEYGEW